MTDGDIHNRQGRINNLVARIQNLENISENNRQILLNFKDYLYSQDLSQDRISRHLYNWVYMIECIEFELDEAEKSDIIRLLGKVNESKVSKKDDLAEATKCEYKKSIRKLYSDYFGATRDDIDGKELTKFFTATAKRKRIDPDRLPRPQHVRKLVRRADRARDKAFLMILWSSAGRIGEILGLKWKDVKFQDDVAKLRFRETKTGGDRKVPLLAGYLYLKELYRSDHKSDDPEAFIFRSITSDKQISYQGASQIITRLREESDIPDRIKTNPHAFRKGRATYLAAQGMNQSTLCEFGGWVQGSDNVAVYVRMADSDVEAGVKKAAGIEVEEEEEERDLHPVKCHECREMNKFEAENCRECDAVLNTSELFTQVQIEKSADKLTERVMKEKIGLDDEKINQHAKEIVAEDLGMEVDQL